MSKKFKRWSARIILVGSLILWPISAFTFAQGEPPTVLHLSWAAIILTALDGVWITED